MTARNLYEEWCRRHGKRKSQAGWEIWEAAYECGLSYHLAKWDELSEKQREHVAALVREMAEWSF